MYRICIKGNLSLNESLTQRKELLSIEYLFCFSSQDTLRTWFTTRLSFPLDSGSWFPRQRLRIHQRSNNIFRHRNAWCSRRSRGTDCPCWRWTPSKGEESLWMTLMVMMMWVTMMTWRWFHCCLNSRLNGSCCRRFFSRGSWMLRGFGFQEIFIQVWLKEPLICICLKKTLYFPLSSVKGFDVSTGKTWLNTVTDVSIDVDLLV